MAVFTVVLAVGQAIGPLLTGWLADATQSLRAGLAGSAAILPAASAVALCRRESHTETASSRRSPRISPPRTLGTAR